MTRHTADVQLAHETLATAAADPAILEFDLRDSEAIQRWADGADSRRLVAASRFFAFREHRRTQGTAARSAFLQLPDEPGQQPRG